MIVKEVLNLLHRRSDTAECLLCPRKDKVLELGGVLNMGDTSRTGGVALLRVLFNMH